VVTPPLLLLAYNIPTVRPSKDIDFLGQETSNEIDQIELTRDIAAMNNIDRFPKWVF
jgi:hypothetical protein